MNSPIDNSTAELIASMTQAIAAYDLERPLMVGIYTGGSWIAEQIHAELALEDPLGSLDISYYRDDFDRVGLSPHIKASSLPVSIEDRHIILIDDVFHTGRSARAAMNEIFSYGRPLSIKLCVMVLRTGRELPIQPDFAACSITIDGDDQIKLVRQDNQLCLNMVQTGDDKP